MTSMVGMEFQMGSGREERGIHYIRLAQRRWVRTERLLQGFQSQSTKDENDVRLPTFILQQQYGLK